MKRLIVICLFSTLLFTPQQYPFAKEVIKEIPTVRIDTSTVDALLEYRWAKYNNLVSLNNKLMDDNSKRTKVIQHKVDSIFHQ